MANQELETLDKLFAVLNEDTTLTQNSGINPFFPSQSRDVAIFNQVKQDTPVPYVRVTISDTVPLEAESMDFSTIPNAHTVSGLIDIFSDYEPEVLSIRNRIYELLQNQVFTTPNFSGSSWITGCVFFVDDTSNPDKIYRRGTCRVRVNLA